MSNTLKCLNLMVKMKNRWWQMCHDRGKRMTQPCPHFLKHHEILL
jgi:hypothetical protein